MVHSEALVARNNLNKLQCHKTEVIFVCGFVSAYILYRSYMQLFAFEEHFMYNKNSSYVAPKLRINHTRICTTLLY